MSDSVWQPEEVAVLTLFLGSDQAGYINGVEFTIDAGDTAGGNLDSPGG